MLKKVIPITDGRFEPAPHGFSTQPEASFGSLVDALSRSMRDLRISVTDRCNFRCVYCMPRAIFDRDYPYLPHDALLSFEEITRVARAFVDRGVEKIRFTGGEPLLRKDIEKLIAMLSAIRTPEGRALDLTLTTNGSLLAKKAQALRDAGLQRVTVSLDSLDDAIFKRMNDADFPVAEVLHGIDVAHRIGLGPIKVNMVVKRGINDKEIIPMARYFKNTPHVVRYIEYMDVGNSNGWKMSEVVPSSEVLQRIAAEMPLAAVNRRYAGETAQRWRYIDGAGEIGLISSVTHAFCGDCSRARLSTEGKLYTCLFAANGHDLRTLLRAGRSDAEISNAVERVWRTRADRYSAQRSEKTREFDPSATRIEMSYIGG